MSEWGVFDLELGLKTRDRSKIVMTSEHFTSFLFLFFGVTHILFNYNYQLVPLDGWMDGPLTAKLYLKSFDCCLPRLNVSSVAILRKKRRTS